MPSNTDNPGCASSETVPPIEGIPMQSSSLWEVEPASETFPMHFWLLSLGLCLGLFLSIIDSSIVATALYTIGKDLEDLTAINWVALSYTLSCLGFAVAFARISDVIGRRSAFLVAHIFFVVFSYASGSAKTLPQLIAFRALQGIGGSGLYSMTMITLPEICPPRYFQFIGSMIGMVIASAGVLGPILGAVITEYTKWYWIFYINGPISALSIFLLVAFWPTKEQHNPPKRLQWRHFDFFGTFLIITAAVLLVFAFQNSGVSFNYTFNSAVFIAPTSIGLLCWFGAIAWASLVQNGHFGKQLLPALPVKLLQNRFYLSGFLTTLLIGYPYLQIVFIFPTRAQVVSGKSALVSGLQLLPMLGASAFGSGISAIVSKKRNFLSEVNLASCCLTLIGCMLLSKVKDGNDDAKAQGFLVFAGLGFGLSTASATIMVSQEASVSERAVGHGFLAQGRLLGGSFGIAVASVLLRKYITRNLGGQVSAEDIEELAKGLSGFDEGKRYAIIAAYGVAFQVAMATATIVSTFAVLVSVLGLRKTRTNMKKESIRLLHEDETQRANPNAPSGERNMTT